jgi:hypothetical protein
VVESLRPEGLSYSKVEIALIDRVLGGEYPSKGAAFPRSIRSIQVSDRVTPTQPKAIYCPVVTLLALPR